MTYEISSHPNSTKIARISALIDSLKTKVKDFDVIDHEKQIVGQVRDLIIDTNRQLNFVVSQADSYEKSRLFVLSSKLVEKIDSQIQKIFITVDKSQIENLPEYIVRESQVSEMEQNLNSQATEIQDSAITTPVVNATENSSDSLEEIIRLLGERLIIERSKRKVGEVIVRKEIEIQMVQVPIRREKLIVEQVSPEHKKLAEIDLGQEEITDLDLNLKERALFSNVDGALSVSGEFTSPKVASLLLNAIALEQNHGCKAVQVTILVENEECQKKYQEWFSRTSRTATT